MFVTLLVFFLLFFLIYFLSPSINTKIYHLFFLLTRSKNLALSTLIIILLPGTIIHELSHFLVATLLFVRSGELTILPKLEEGRIKAGSLRHADTDPFRRTLIGLAPMVVGLMIIYIVGNLFLPQIYDFKFLISNFYILFTLSISMFSSRKDLEMARFLIPVILLVVFVLYLNGITLTFSTDILNRLNFFFSELNFYLLVTLGLDTAIFLFLSLAVKLLENLFKIKLVKLKD